MKHKFNNPFLEAALYYFNKGLCPIPLKPRSKQALISWKSYNKFRPIKENIIRWWSQTPKANVGIVCGSISGVFAVEFDDEKILKKIELPVTPQSVSGGKKLPHVFFKYSPLIKNKSIKADCGKEIYSIRSDNSYIVVPPSIHPNSNRYIWAYGLDFNSVEPSLPPYWIINQYKNEYTIRDKNIIKTNFTASNKRFDSKKEKFLKSIITKYWTEGNRQNLALYVAGFLCKHGVSRDNAVELITDIAKNNKDCELAQRIQAVNYTYNKYYG